MDDLRGARIAIYARYSSDNQSEASIEDQVYRCQKWIEQRGGAVRDELIHADYALSGASAHRPQLQALLEKVEAKPRGVDVIVMEDVSRLARDLADSAAIYKRVRFCDVTIIGIADGVDTSDHGAKLTFGMKSLIAEMYRDDLADKTRRGLEGRFRHGGVTGGLPYGYRSEAVVDEQGRARGKRPRIDPAKAAIVREIFEQYDVGVSFASIAARLNQRGVPAPRADSDSRKRGRGWQASGVRAMLRNETYAGRWSFNRREFRRRPGDGRRTAIERTPNEVLRDDRPDLAIVDRAVFDRVKAKFEARRSNRNASHRGKRSAYPLSGILRCGTCRGLMTITGGHRKRYRCRNNKNRGNTECDNPRTIRMDDITEFVLGEIAERFARPEAMAYLRERISERLERRRV